MLGVIVNVLAVIVGGSIGMLLKKGIPQRISDAVMKGVGLCILYIGISGVMKGQNTLVLILSIVTGAAVGELLDLDARLQSGAKKLETLMRGPCGKGGQIAEGFVTASLLFCVGAMTVVGSLESGLTGNNEIIYTKSTLDFISSVIFASALGVGVIFSSAFILVFQGSIVLLAKFVSPYLTEYAIGEMTCAGSLLIIALGLNVIGITKFKIMNYLPAVFLPIMFCLFIK